MAVVTVNIGTKRVALTAYCPDDALGLAACDYVLERVKDVLGVGVSPQAFREYLIAKNPEWAEVFKMIDDGWQLPLNPPWSVDPRNIRCELRIIEHLYRELIEQGRSPNEYALRVGR